MVGPQARQGAGPGIAAQQGAAIRWDRTLQPPEAIVTMRESGRKASASRSISEVFPDLQIDQLLEDECEQVGQRTFRRMAFMALNGGFQPAGGTGPGRDMRRILQPNSAISSAGAWFSRLSLGGNRVGEDDSIAAPSCCSGRRQFHHDTRGGARVFGDGLAGSSGVYASMNKTLRQ